MVLLDRGKTKPKTAWELVEQSWESGKEWMKVAYQNWDTKKGNGLQIGLVDERRKPDDENEMDLRSSRIWNDRRVVVWPEDRTNKCTGLKISPHYGNV